MRDGMASRTLANMHSFVGIAAESCHEIVSFWNLSAPTIGVNDG